MYLTLSIFSRIMNFTLRLCSEGKRLSLIGSVIETECAAQNERKWLWVHCGTSAGQDRTQKQ